MGCGEEKTNLFLSNLTVRKKSKGSLFKEKPIFIEKGSCLLVAIGKSCHLYSSTTGERIKELFQCEDNIVACQLHPTEPSSVVSITENGEVTVFNLKSCKIVKSIKLTLNQKILKKKRQPKFSSEHQIGDMDFDWMSQPLDSLNHRKFVYAEVRAFQNNSSNVYVWATWSLNDEPKSRLTTFTFENGKHIPFVHLGNTGLKKCYGNIAVGSVHGVDIFIAMSLTYVHVGRFELKKPNVHQKHYLGAGIELTCVALHPSECVFATGDSLGKITIWRNIFEKNPLKDTLHWHFLPVQDIYFSKLGNYMFSGGGENVLVKWSLATHSKDFLPRLSSTIYRISGDTESSLLSVSTQDNKITILDYSFHFVSTIQHFSLWFVDKRENRPYVFAWDPRMNSLVLNGRTGHIQFLSLIENEKLVYTFDVTNRNYITDGNKIVENTDVTHASFTKDGKWLVTVESRTDEFFKESRLKFWMYSTKESSFVLNTNVELPHEESDIYSLEVSTNDKVATTGADKKFRLWTLFLCQQWNKHKETWSLENSGKYRNLPCYAVDFSKDASLVAVTFGPVLTIWETESCVLKCSLSVPNKKENLKVCKFGNNEFSHLIVTGTDFGVSSWNTITLSMIWTVPLKLSVLVSDPFSVYMAAFSEDYSLVIFNPFSPSPDLLLKKVSSSAVVAALFVSEESRKLCLYFLTSDQELYCVENEDKAASVVTHDVPKPLLTPFASQIAETRNQTEKESKKISLKKNNVHLVATLLDSPAHTLPNPSLLCSDVLKGLLLFSDVKPTDAPSLKAAKSNEFVAVEHERPDNANKDSDQMEGKLLNIVGSLFI